MINMAKILERNVAEILTISIMILMLMSSCSSDYKSIDTIASVECENCDEVD